jgi:acetyl esterase/lipase
VDEGTIVTECGRRIGDGPRTLRYGAAVRRTRSRYGPRRGQVAELWHPDDRHGDVPVVVVVHGGFWRAPYTKVLTRRLAHAVASRGWAAWNVEYARVGPLGGGGGWPTTLTDVAAAVDSLADHDGIDLDRVVACGHSAGGHLALWLAARPRLGADDPGAAPRVPVCGAVALAGMGDLTDAARRGLGGGAVDAFLGGTPAAVADRYRVASPVEHLPLGVPQVLVHGLADTVVPPEMSSEYVDTARAAGDDATYVALAGVGHRAVAAPRGPAWDAVAGHLTRLLGP